MESEENTDLRREIFKRLAERNWPLLGEKSTELSLEDIFLRLTSGKSVDYRQPASGEEKKEAAPAGTDAALADAGEPEGPSEADASSGSAGQADASFGEKAPQATDKEDES